MNRRGFFGKLSTVLAFLGIGATSVSASARSRAPASVLKMLWRPVEGDVTSWSDGARDKVTEELDVVFGDWRLRGRLIYLQRPSSGSIWRFDVEVDWHEAEPDNRDPLRASSWGNTLDITRERAELALRLLLDVKRVENHQRALSRSLSS